MDDPEFVPRKIAVFREQCDEYEWDYIEDWFGEDYRVKAWRNEGEERIQLIWRDRYFSADESWYELVDVRKKVLSNQAEAVRFVKANPDYTFARDEDGRKALITNVFDFSDYEDKEIIGTLAGRKLTWTNRLTQEHEIGHVPPRGKWTSIGIASTGRKFVTFADSDGTGFRSVALEAIIKIK